ncbi:hypothetical protein VIGAN_01531100 [Vigna angularis var. angularis]|uniref:Uncharacterized protein n=1 Tax=Vigna angularis var. angularis TaxID=157739 RepID=A0A0S3R9N2_PHAAN|nr:hypothetical protein VIGAN_01531100 [Vigna angularis var. angularis]
MPNNNRGQTSCKPEILVSVPVPFSLEPALLQPSFCSRLFFFACSSVRVWLCDSRFVGRVHEFMNIYCRLDFKCNVTVVW